MDIDLVVGSDHRGYKLKTIIEIINKEISN